MTVGGLRGLAVAAELTWLQHQVQPESWAPGRCKQCAANGCALLAWAVTVRVGRSARYPAMGAPASPSLRVLATAA